MHQNIRIDQDIKKAETLPAWFYRNEKVFERLKEIVFLTSWQFIGHSSMLPNTGDYVPLDFLPGFVNEPILLTKEKENSIRCLTNVCTHRANILIHETGNGKQLRCQYHGRRFGLDGTFRSMPEFEEAEDFPRPCDHLKEFPLINWNSFLFSGLEPALDLMQVFEQMQERIGFFPFDQLEHTMDLDRDYEVKAHWALYCDNYLEGFHIPYVHPDLNSALEYGDYETLCYDNMVLQIGFASGTEDCFDLPEGHIDHNRPVAAYYYWIFPNMMFNFYPWGISVNVVQPVSPTKTKISFLTYVSDETKLNRGAGARLDQVEMEDEYVVQGVQRGLQSRYYERGRFSPRMEQGVHHFHRMLADYYNQS